MAKLTSVTYFFSSPVRKKLLLGVGFLLLVCGLAWRTHYQLVFVSGTSMLPTFSPGDVLIIDRLAYANCGPGRNEIVVAKYRGGLVLKRVIGLPGEKVGLRKGRLYINGAPLHESHRINPGSLDVGEGKLLPGDYATVGDNRAVVPALAIHPIVTRADIVGKAVFAFGKRIW